MLQAEQCWLTVVVAGCPGDQSSFSLLLKWLESKRTQRGTTTWITIETGQPNGGLKCALWFTGTTQSHSPSHTRRTCPMCFKDLTEIKWFHTSSCSVQQSLSPSSFTVPPPLAQGCDSGKNLENGGRTVLRRHLPVSPSGHSQWLKRCKCSICGSSVQTGEKCHQLSLYQSAFRCQTRKWLLALKWTFSRKWTVR